ncbi:MAG: hypothetical protein AB7Q37_18675 [Pyrinomonadaceae bacterium]
MAANQQYREDQEPTVTSKSSGIEYIHSQLDPRQGEADTRSPVTDNDNGKKG